MLDTDAVHALPAPALTRDGHPRRWLILAVVLIADGMELIDGTITNVAAPTIRDELGASTAALQWIAGGYALAMAAGLLPAARLGDVYGRRRIFRIGTIGFVLASLLCGLAPSAGALIAFRVVQGLAAALVLPQIVGILHAAFAPEELPKAFGAFGPILNLSAAAGPVLGGLLVGADLFGIGWRLLFFVNVPIGLVAIVGAFRILPESRTPGAPTLDVRGALLSALAMVLLIYPLIEGREAGWPAWTFAMMAASVLSFALFVRLSLRTERAGGHPLVTPSVLRKRPFTAGVTVALVTAAAVVGLSLTLTLYYQLGLGFSPAHAGVSWAPWSLGSAAGAALSGFVLTPRYGRRVLHAGVLMVVAGTLALLAVVEVHGSQLTTLVLAGPVFACGFGNGLMGAPLLASVLGVVDEREVGSASGVLTALFQLGASIGVAVLGTLFFAVASASGYGSAIESVLWVQAGLFAAAGALAFALPRKARAVMAH